MIFQMVSCNTEKKISVFLELVLLLFPTLGLELVKYFEVGLWVELRLRWKENEFFKSFQVKQFITLYFDCLFCSKWLLQQWLASTWELLLDWNKQVLYSDKLYECKTCKLMHVLNNVLEPPFLHILWLCLASILL